MTRTDRVRRLVRFALLLGVLGMAVPPALRAAPAPPGPGSPAAGTYHIAAGDVLEITVHDQPDLTRVATVLPDGRISFPYLGDVAVSGRTVGDVTRLVTDGLQGQLVSPQVTVTVQQRQSQAVSVLGAVRVPGKHTFQEGWRVVDALADSGGLSVGRPEWASAVLIRGGQATPVDLARVLADGDPAQNVPLLPGDVLSIAEVDPLRTHVQIVGEVAKPGVVPVPSDGSVLAALTAAGGATPRAALSRAAILRGGRSIPINLAALMTSGDAGGAARLAPGDTLLIPQNTLRYAVFGAVRTAGALDYPDGQRLTVLSALADAGGQDQAADLQHASLVRPAQDGRPARLIQINLEQMLAKGDLSADVPVLPGDILYLPKKSERPHVGISDVLSVIPFVNLLR